MARRSMGRQKVEMKKIPKESNLLVTFSKRKSGVFKKASELCTLCGVEAAILVFSPGKNKVYSFGHPNLKHVIDKFSTGENPIPTTDSALLQPAEPYLARLTHLTELDDHLETQMAYGEGLTEERKKRQAMDWIRAPAEDLGLEQLQTLDSGFMKLMSSVADRIKNLSLMPQAQNLTGPDKEGGEALDASGHSLGVIATANGYALC